MKTNFRTWYKPYNNWINSIVLGEHGHVFSYTVSLENQKAVKCGWIQQEHRPINFISFG